MDLVPLYFYCQKIGYQIKEKCLNIRKIKGWINFTKKFKLFAKCAWHTPGHHIEQYKPVLKDHRLEKAVHAVAGLRTVGYACDDITVEDIETGMTSVIFGANKSKLTSNSQLVT